jgi:signal transduction histidine kinase/CheY-like chemotaxis protein
VSIPETGSGGEANPLVAGGLSHPVIDALLTFVAVLTPDGRVQFIDATSLSAARLSLGQVTGSFVWDTYWWDFEDTNRSQLNSACSRAAQGENIRLDMPMRNSHGLPTAAEVTVVPLLGSAGEVQQLVVSAVDVTAKNKAEIALHAKDRRKDEFLAMLAHELRNPLAPLRNAAALMRLSDEGNPQRAAISALIDRQVRHLARLLDDLLDASRIDQGKIALCLEPLDLRALVQQTLEGARAMTDARGQQVILSMPAQEVWISADPVRTTQIIDNLLSNAAKFTDAEGTIRITLTAEQGEASLSIADNGQGIEEELLPHVFDLFTQGTRSLDRSQGGLGIGLSLVRNLTLMHGGNVTALSEGNGRGSEFVVNLPLLAEGAPKAPPARLRPPQFQARRVLVVDDNVDAAESLAELLALKGHDAKAVTESKLALTLAADFAPEVVLLDIGLPELDGYQVAQLLPPGQAGQSAATRRPHRPATVAVLPVAVLLFIAATIPGTCRRSAQAGR